MVVADTAGHTDREAFGSSHPLVEAAGVAVAAAEALADLVAAALVAVAPAGTGNYPNPTS